MFKRCSKDVQKMFKRCSKDINDKSGWAQTESKPKIHKTKDEKLMCQKVVKIERKKIFFFEKPKNIHASD